MHTPHRNQFDSAQSAEDHFQWCPSVIHPRTTSKLTPRPRPHSSLSFGEVACAASPRADTKHIRNLRDFHHQALDSRHRRATDQPTMRVRVAVSPLEQLAQLNSLLLSLESVEGEKEFITRQPPRGENVAAESTMMSPAALTTKSSERTCRQLPASATMPPRRPKCNSLIQPRPNITPLPCRTTSITPQPTITTPRHRTKPKTSRVSFTKDQNLNAKFEEWCREERARACQRTRGTPFTKSSVEKITPVTFPSTASNKAREPAFAAFWEVIRSFLAFVHSLWVLATFLVLGAIGIGQHTRARQTHTDKRANKFTAAIEELHACNEDFARCKSALLHVEKCVAHTQHHLHQRSQDTTKS